MTEKYIERFHADFKKNQDHAFVTFNNKLEKEIYLFKNYFDNQQKLFFNHYPGITYFFQDYEIIVMQAYWKSTHLAYTVNDLILHGDYGSARILMRQAFEFLLLGKYMASIKDNRISSQWLEGRQFNIYDRIIKLLKVPDKKLFHNFWTDLSKQVHAGSGALQVGIVDEVDDDVLSSYCINYIILCCKNSLLQKNLINRKLTYFSNTYLKKKEENKALRQRMRLEEKLIFDIISDDGIALIKDYRKDWEFKK